MAANASRTRGLGWPSFPLAGPLPHVQAISHRDLVLEARIVDSAGYHAATQICDFLAHVGFDVGQGVDRSSQQYACTCGIVAAKRACDIHLAGDNWRWLDLSNAVDDQWTSFANFAVPLFSDAVLDGRARLPPGTWRAEGRPPSRFTSAQEVVRMTQLFWQSECGDMLEDIAAALELPGPPCDRCGHDHLSRECPDCPEPRPPNCCEWFAAVSTDQLLSDAARDVQSVRSTGSEQFRIFACSDSNSLGEGSHWFTVAYRIRRRAVCMSIERFPLILVLASLLGAFLCLLLLTPLTLQQPS